MGKKLNLESLSDAALLRRLSEMVQQTRGAEADLIAHIAEVDARRAYAREAVPSMHAYCTEILHLSEPETWLRIRVARASRKHPVLLEMLRDGQIHLSGIALLAPHLTPRNRRTLLKRATHKSKRQIEEIVAELEPRPDAPTGMRKLPAPRKQDARSPAFLLRPDAVGASADGRRSDTAAPTEMRPDAVGVRSDNVVTTDLALRPDAVGTPPAPAPPRPATVEALAPARYSVRFTASAELRDKLERLQALMRSSVPDGDLAKIIEEAVTEKLERLESKRFGKTKAPRKGLAETDTTPSSRHIPAPVRRAVHERDKGQCTYVDTHGRRCKAREGLEFHHRKPFGRGGEHSPTNVGLLCKSHNALLAEHDYGKERMARYRRQRPTKDRVSEPLAVYAGANRGARGHSQAPP